MAAGSGKLIVSFTSDSDDEANTSSCSHLSSGNDVLSSEDEKAATNKTSHAYKSKTKPDGKASKPSLDDDLPDLSPKKKPTKNGPSAEIKVDALVKTDTSLTDLKPASLADPLDNEAAEGKKQKKSKRKSPTSEEGVPVKVETGFEAQPEEKGLAPPAKTKFKSRSKSPREGQEEIGDTKNETAVPNGNGLSEELILTDVVPKASKKKSKISSVDNILSAEPTKLSESSETSLAPVETKTKKKRSKSPKDAESISSVDGGVDLTRPETADPLMLEAVAEKPVKTKKKKKQSSEEKEESAALDAAKAQDSKPLLDFDDVISTTDKKKKSKENEIDAPRLVVTNEETASKIAVTSEPVDFLSEPNIIQPVSETELQDKLEKKKSPLDFEIPSTTINPEASALKKKPKRLSADLTNGDNNVDHVSLTDSLKEGVEINGVTTEKPKKRKSKGLIEADAMLGSSEATKDEFTAAPKSAERDEPLERDEKLLEHAMEEEKVTSMAMNEVEEMPNNEVRIVKAESDNKESLTAKQNEDIINKVDTDDKSVDKESTDSLNDEIARFLNSGPTKAEDILKGIKPSGESKKEKSAAEKSKSSTAVDDKLSDDESMANRRQSMDDFIKKILAEAREERQKLKANIEDASGARDPGLGGSTQDATGKGLDDSMLERRLASVEKRRQAEDKTDKVNGIPSLKDDDDDDISRLLSQRRAQRKAQEDLGDFEDSVSLVSDASTRRGVYNLEDHESMGPTKPPLGLRTKLRDEEPQESFVARYRRERAASQLPEDSFTPQRSEQTDEIVRERTRHIKVICDQQADVAKSMRNTSRGLDDLDTELKNIRQMALDWQARIEALEAAVDAEYRSYESDIHAANERLKQQNTPDDRYLREELRGMNRPVRRVAERYRGEPAEDEGFVPGSRRRSGSMASTVSLASSFAGRNGGLDSGLDMDNYGYGSGRRDFRRSESETDVGGDRFRRGGSLARDRLSDMLGRDDDDDYGLSRNSRAGSQRRDGPSASDEVMRIKAKYSSLSNSGGGYTPPTRTSFGSDVSGSSYLYPSSSSYLSSSRHDTPLYSSRLSDRDSYGSSGLGASSLSGYDSTRMRRAQSVSDMSYDRPSYRPSSTYGEPGTDFKSKFLSRVRGSGSASASTGGPSLPRPAGKPFKSRFLRSTSGVDGSSTPSRFSSSPRGTPGMGGGPGGSDAAE